MKRRKKRKPLMTALKSRQLIAKAILDLNKRVGKIEAERAARTIRGFDTDCQAYAESDGYREIEDIAYDDDAVIG